MKCHVTIVFFLAYFNTASAVANGSVQAPYSSPWQAKVYFSSSDGTSWPCGGTIISENHVLLAAGCLTYLNTNYASNVHIYFGAWDLEKSEKGRVMMAVSLENATIHEGYESSTHANDIALIQLSESLTFSEKIQPISLSNNTISVGEVARITGWQYPYSERELGHHYIHGGDVTIVDNSLCKDTYPSYDINENSICASGKVAFCYGEEGIALPFNGEIVGMAYGAQQVTVSHEECPIQPQVYINIAKYLDWIKNNM